MLWVSGSLIGKFRAWGSLTVKLELSGEVMSVRLTHSQVRGIGRLWVWGSFTSKFWAWGSLSQARGIREGYQCEAHSQVSFGHEAHSQVSFRHEAHSQSSERYQGRLWMWGSLTVKREVFQALIPTEPQQTWMLCTSISLFNFCKSVCINFLHS